jgi:putative membrane protein
MRPANALSFIQQAAESNQFEIQSSQLALQKSKNAELKKFAQRMIDDHTKIADELKALLAKANIPVPEIQLGPQDQALLAKLKNEKEAAFDRTYVMDQRKGHIQAVNLVEAYAKNGEIPALKQFASKILPTLKEHLKLAQQLPGGQNLSARLRR